MIRRLAHKMIRFNALFRYFLFFAVLSYLLLSAYDPGRTGELYKTQSQALLFLLVGMTTLLWMLKNPRISGPQLGLIFFTGLVFFVSTIGTLGGYSGAMSGLINNFVAQGLILVFFIALLNSKIVPNTCLPRILALILVVFGVLTALIGWQVLLTGSGLFGGYSFTVPLHHQVRLTGFHSSSNYSGHALAFALLSSVYLASCSQATRKFYWYLLVVFLGLSLLATGSRGSILIGTLGVSIFVIANMRLRWKIGFSGRGLFFTLLGMFSIASVVFYISQTEFFRISLYGWERLLTRTEKAGGLEGEARVVMLMDGLRYWLNGDWFQQLFGFGNAAYQESVFHHSPHNSYLLILFDRGIVALLMLLIFFFASIFFIRYSHFSKSEKALFLGLYLIIALRGLFQSGELVSPGLNWSILLYLSLSSLIMMRKLTSTNSRSEHAH